MASKITCIVNDSGAVKVNFEGDHLRKLLINRVVKAIKHAHRRNIIDYRLGIKAETSRVAAVVIKEEAEKTKNLGVEHNGDRDTKSKEGEASRESREPARNKIGGVASPSQRKRSGEASEHRESRSSSGREKAVLLARARGGVASSV